MSSEEARLKDEQTARLIDSAFEDSWHGTDPLSLVFRELQYAAPERPDEESKAEAEAGALLKALRFFQTASISRQIESPFGLQFHMSDPPFEREPSVASEIPRAQTLALEDLVRELRSPSWEFRTVLGLADDLGVEPPIVEAVLDEFPELVRRLPAFDKEGHELLAYAGRRPTWKERIMRLRAYFGKLS